MGGSPIALSAPVSFRLRAELLRFAFDTKRPWIGGYFFANRSQDWRLKGGREECIERAGRLPVRTLHTITKSIADEPRDFETSENVELVDGEVKPADEALGGFLIGAGNEGVNCRISALAKHRPAEDGGNLAVIEGRVLALGE